MTEKGLSPVPFRTREPAPLSRKLKEHVLREFGDEGADTLGRYFTQIEYTAYLCIRMLYAAEGIEQVIPEGVEDVVVVRRGRYELHQVKTRDESQGPWTNAEAFQVLYQQYARRKAFSGQCEYHFVSNQMADNKTGFRTGSLGPMFLLKHLLEIKHDGEIYSPEEQGDMEEFENILVPRLREALSDPDGSPIDEATALMLLHNTWLETDTPLRDRDNVSDLNSALRNIAPDAPYITVADLEGFYDRLLLLIIRRIINGRSLEARSITRDDVLNCRTNGDLTMPGYPDLSNTPGKTHLEKKALLGGFDMTEIPIFSRQMKLAEWPKRQMESLGMTDSLQRLTIALLDLQSHCRHEICRERKITDHPGPMILNLLRPRIPTLAERYLPGVRDADEQFCLGILWEETNLCLAWWHPLEDAAAGGTQ